MSFEEVAFPLCSGIFELGREFAGIYRWLYPTFFQVIWINIDAFIVRVLSRELVPDFMDLAEGGDHARADDTRKRLCQSPDWLGVCRLLIGGIQSSITWVYEGRMLRS